MYCNNMNQDDLYQFFFRNREFKMFNEIFEIMIMIMIMIKYG